MAKPPTPTQKRYRGKVRADIRSAYNHLKYLDNRDKKLLAGPQAVYPNQMYASADRNTIQACIAVLFDFIGDKGPIPDRGP